MDRHCDDDWFLSLLTAASFLAMLLTWIFALLDALDGSPWYALEFALGFVCGVSFVSMLTTQDPLSHPLTIETGSSDDVHR